MATSEASHSKDIREEHEIMDFCKEHEWKEMWVYHRPKNIGDPLEPKREIICEKCHFPKEFDGDFKRTVEWFEGRKAFNHVAKHFGDLYE